MTDPHTDDVPLCPILSTPGHRTEHGREVPATMVDCRRTGCALYRRKDPRCALVEVPAVIDDADRVAKASQEVLASSGRVLSSVRQDLPAVLAELRKSLRGDLREQAEGLQAWHETHRRETDDAIRSLETLVGTLLEEMARQREAERRKEAEVAVAGARVHVRCGRMEEALAAVREARESLGATADLLNTEGVVFLRLGHAGEAERTLRAAIELEPAFAPARVNRALALRRLGRPEEALEEAREALRLAPTSGAAWNTLGNLHFEAGRPTRALDAWRRAVDVDPTMEAAIENLRRQQVLEDHPRRDLVRTAPGTSAPGRKAAPDKAAKRKSRKRRRAPRQSDAR